MIDYRTYTAPYFHITVKKEQDIMDYSQYKIPVYTQTTIKQEPQDEDTVLNLCVRKRPLSPNYTLSYPSPRSSPDTIETPLCLTSPKSLSGGSETSDLSNLSDVARDSSNMSPSRIKSTRPFKIFPKDPLALTLDVASKIDPLVEGDSSMSYYEFRDKMLEKLRLNNNNRTNQNMRRMQTHSEKATDPSYLEKRKKNNEAAKRSRDARRAKEEEIVVRCAFLAQENLKLKSRIAVLEGEMERLRRRAFHS